MESPCSSRDESKLKVVSYGVKLNYMYPVRDQDTLIEQSP